jgi:hypothetical protein
VLKILLIFHEAPHTVAQLYECPHRILDVFNAILYENEFQNPPIFQQTINLFPEQSTLTHGPRVKFIYGGGGGDRGRGGSKTQFVV